MLFKAAFWSHTAYKPGDGSVNQHVVNQMCILGTQLDFVHVWDTHCQALFVFPALSSHVSVNNGCNTALHSWASWWDGAGSRGWRTEARAGDTARSRGWNGMELGETLGHLPVPEGAALQLERDFRHGSDRIRGMPSYSHRAELNGVLGRNCSL